MPVIVVTGALGDEAVVECLKRGAADYLLKDRLARLGPAVSHALDERLARREQRRVARALHESEARKAAILESALDGIVTVDDRARIVEFNPAAEAIFGYPRGEVVGRSFAELVLPPEAREPFTRGLAEVVNSGQSPMIGRRSELTAIRADGAEILIELAISRIGHEGPQLFGAFVRDITERRAAERALSHLADLVQASDDAIIGESPDGLITAWNPGAVHLFGYTAAEIIGQPIALLAPPSRREEDHWMLEQIRRGQRIQHFETVRRRKDGSEVLVSFTVSPFRDASGRIAGASTIGRDVTAQRRAEQEVTRLNHDLEEHVDELQTLLELIPVSVWIGDATAGLITANRAAYEMMGLPIGANLSLTSPEAVAGTTPGFRWFRNGSEIPPDEQPMQAVARTGVASRNLEHELVFDDGRSVSIQGSVAPLFDDWGKVRGVVGAWVDVTDRKATEEALREASRRKDRFVAALSHELRTPLTPVLLIISALTEAPSTPDELRPHLAMIRENVELEARLIDDLLDVARIAQGKLQLNRELVDVHSLILQAVQTCGDAIQDGRLHLALDLTAADRRVLADPVRLQQIFWNLIKNAAKFTPDGGAIAIRSCNEPGTADGEAGGWLVVEVSDTGIGIESQDFARIFRVFEQGDASLRRRFGGLGLGLAIGQAVAEAHGGRLDVDSPGKDRGSTFTLRLPAAASPAPEPPIRPPSREGVSPAAPLRILLVEDNTDTLKFLSVALSRRRHTVRPAADLATARALAAAEEFDVLISDIGLPDGSGLELMDEIQKTRRFPGIAISGFGSEEDIRASKAAGFSEHLTKPVTFQTLEATLWKVAATDARALAMPSSR